MPPIIFTLITLFTLATTAVFDVPAPPPPDLSADEIAGLTYMVEEEKLAHDVYVALYDVWDTPVFNNIAAAETTHAAAVGRLLDRYGIANPATTNPPGVFTDPDLQALYDRLVVEGSASRAAAFAVGATIEEVDIADLQARLATSHHADITAVYSALLRGSGNHLRAYVKQWDQATGQTYTPQVLSAADYAAILGASNGNGNGNGRGGGGGRWGQSRVPGQARQPGPSVVRP
jgi:hypothetical protein